MLATLLSAVRSARDLAPVFEAMGYSADLRSLDDDTIVVARWKGFEIVGLESDRPEDAARSHATRLAASARRAIVAVVGGGELCIAAPRLGATGSTRVLTLSLADPNPDALRILERLAAGGAPHPLGHALRVGELLSTESVGERFYRAFRENLERMAASLGRNGTPTDRRTAALLPLTRVLFLYFVQEKGWLDGKGDYLPRLFDATLTRRRHFHRSALHPLFFGTLNRRPADRRITIGLGRIPYLNGGLFEPHAVERRLGPVVFSNELWRDAFDGLFERFRFSVRESRRTDAIAPDMLGRVFERIMDPGDRHRTGTYYTPESVVRQLVDVAITTALGTSPTLDTLKALRVLDPAVGSGAFLLCTLDRLTELRAAAQSRTASIAATRRDVLRENLFGVDLNPIAVRLAELRLWLAVIADDDTSDVTKVAPLPNLDGVIRQGDTLMDPLGAARAAGGSLPHGAAAATRLVARARRALFEARGAALRPATRELRAAELDLASNLVAAAEEGTERRLRELEAEEQSVDLFGSPRGLTLAQRDERRGLEAQRIHLAASRQALAEGQVPFFSFEVHAAEIMATGGFGIVLGNPPWVRAERLARGFRRALRERFSWWHGGGAGPVRGYSHMPDISVAFLQRAVELATPGGTIGMLVPSKVATAQYAEATRRALVRETSVEYIHRVPDREAAGFGAVTYPMSLVLRKQPPDARHRVRIGSDEAAVQQSSLDRPGPWVLVPDHARDALEEFRQAGLRLADVARPGLGVKTGADGLFLGSVLFGNPSETLLRLDGHEVAIETALIRPALRGRDVMPFGARGSRVVLWCYASSGTPLETLPPLARQYFEARADTLRGRADRYVGPDWTVFRTRGAFAEHPVAWADITRRPAAVALGGPASDRPIPLNTCYVAAAPDEVTALAIVGVFNSTWSRAFIHHLADEARGGYRRVNARVAGELPVPSTPQSIKRVASVSRRGHDGAENTQDDLDDAVAEALSLTARACQDLRALAAPRR